jgi:hypothetical protein
VSVRDVILNNLGLANIPVRPAANAIVWEDRLPRALVAAACGAGLGLCGVVMQALLRNPLADPFILGVSSGASTGAVLVAVLGLGSGALGLSAGAFIGALVAFALALVLARAAAAGTSGVILAGVAGTHFFSAVTSLIVFALRRLRCHARRDVLAPRLPRGDEMEPRAARHRRGHGRALAVAASAPTLDAFAFGDDVAASLGIHVSRVRTLLFILTALMTATLVSIAGAIGFVGLVLPTPRGCSSAPGMRVWSPRRSSSEPCSWCGWMPHRARCSHRLLCPSASGRHWWASRCSWPCSCDGRRCAHDAVCRPGVVAPWRRACRRRGLAAPAARIDRRPPRP